MKPQKDVLKKVLDCNQDVVVRKRSQNRDDWYKYLEEFHSSLLLVLTCQGEHRHVRNPETCSVWEENKDRTEASVSVAGAAAFFVCLPRATVSGERRGVRKLRGDKDVVGRKRRLDKEKIVGILLVIFIASPPRVVSG